ncbi:MAG TPA: HD-GYP domain-containing protein [Acidimicrobiia bacterium]|jgi:putative nucleotidyltransferase with HDIG domain|nr:HD-GYP domain-containing protein [Acidimicrobiia bacterium]
MRPSAPDRWRERPLARVLVGAAAYLLPLAGSAAAGFTVSRLVPLRGGVTGRVAWALAVVVSAGIAYFVVERVARRLLPLAMLLRLSLLFPDRAPSRFALALRAGNRRRLQAWAQREAASGQRPDAERQAETALTLIAALGAHDRRTRGHSERVQALTDLVAEEVHLSPGDTDRLRWAALLHDIGKLTVPADVLNRPGRPNPAGMRAIRRHPGEGARLAEPLASWLGEWRHAIDQHHERFDGDGYPRGLREGEISLGARVVAVTDAYETMTAVRAYKKAMSIQDARTELVRCAGSHFDPKVVRAFLDISIGRLRRTAGVVAALAEIPLLGLLPRLAIGTSTLAPAATPGLTGAALFGLGVLTFGAHAPTPSASSAGLAARPTATASAALLTAPADGVAVGSPAAAPPSASAPALPPPAGAVGRGLVGGVGTLVNSQLRGLPSGVAALPATLGVHLPLP